MTSKNKVSDNKAVRKKAGPLQTLWLSIASGVLIFNTCMHALTRSLFGKVTRPWVDARMQFWTAQILKLWRITCTVHNPQNIHPQPGQPTILMCNHSSLFDIPVCYAAFPDISLRMLAKKEMSKLPFMGRAMKASEFPFVDRKNRRQAIRDLKAIHDLLETGIVMWIAPEGTRSPDRHVGPFKKGGFITAIQTQAVIIPIGIRGASEILPARTRDCYLNQSAEIHIGEPIDATQFTMDTKEALIHQTREAIKALAGDDAP
jgi:1-acyl-sn-glycerol-3-phosphate acyltransferase